MTYSEAIQFLYSLRWFGTKLGLEHTLRLADLAGNPHRRLRFVHVAGTNGKGSTCAMLESIYRQAGLRTGLFTSPHLVAFAERLQVNRQTIPEGAVIELVQELMPLVQQFHPDEHPTFFEVVTVMALRYFAAEQCDLVIWETGLGGRLDATNIVTPLVSVITNIQYDHQKWLGETLGSIAAEKSGIIKPGVPVVTGTDVPDAFTVIAETARQRGAKLTVVPPDAAERSPLDTLRLPLTGAHQKLNAAVALATVEVLQPAIPVTQAAINSGLQTVNWPGRLQMVTEPSGRKLLLDGAHNLSGAETLARALREQSGIRPVTLVLGILQDKDWAGMCRLLAALARKIVLVPVHSDRTAHPHGLAEVCRQANATAEILELPCLESALKATERDSFVTVAGSLYLVGEAMDLLHLAAGANPQERALNEWGAAAHNPDAARVSEPTHPAKLT